jgi:hypothetical protein
MYVHDIGRIVTEGGALRRLSEINECDKGYPKLNVQKDRGEFSFVESVHASQLKAVYLNIFGVVGQGFAFQFRTSEPVKEIELYGLADGRRYGVEHISSRPEYGFDGYMVKLSGSGLIGYGFNPLFVKLDFGNNNV